MYQALYRKWRPKTFDDVMGQEHITETLKRQITSGRLSHAYLFVGTRGTGKTTCAKILSRAINCENPENGSPCNKCNSCVGIENGSILDVLELDAASNNGVDNVRALREEAVFTPADVKKRVYIIDEVHMLSTAAFNALLKILEEPPEHLIFILATTEIHKVPATILSRCQRFTFKRILPDQIAERLSYVSGQEGIHLTADAADLLARRADGSLRDGLSLLDQCASGDTVDRGCVISAIGLAGSENIAALLTAIADNDTVSALSILDRLYIDGKVMTSVIEELTELIRDVLITSLTPNGGAGLLSGSFDQTELSSFKERFTPEQLMSIMDILRETALGFSKSAGGKLTVELCLLRLCDKQLTTDISSIISRVTRLEENADQQQGTNPPPRQQSWPAIAATEAPAKPAEKIHTPEIPMPVLPIQTAAPAEETQTIPDMSKDTSSDPSPAVMSGDIWKDILSGIESKVDPPQYTFLSDPIHSSAFFDDSTLTIKVKNDFVMKMVNIPSVTAALKETAAAVLKKNIVIRMVQESDNVGSAGNKLDLLKDRFPGVVKVQE